MFGIYFKANKRKRERERLYEVDVLVHDFETGENRNFMLLRYKFSTHARQVLYACATSSLRMRYKFSTHALQVFTHAHLSVLT